MLGDYSGLRRSEPRIWEIFGSDPGPGLSTDFHGNPANPSEWPRKSKLFRLTSSRFLLVLL